MSEGKYFPDHYLINTKKVVVKYETYLILVVYLLIHKAFIGL